MCGNKGYIGAIQKYVKQLERLIRFVFYWSFGCRLNNLFDVEYVQSLTLIKLPRILYFA